MLSRNAKHGCLILSVTVGLLLPARAPADESVRVHSTGPVVVDNPYYGRSSPTLPAAARQASTGEPSDGVNRYYAPRDNSWQRGQPSRWQRSAQRSPAPTASADDRPPFDPFDQPELGAAIVSDRDGPAGSSGEKDEPSNVGTPEITFSDEADGHESHPLPDVLTLESAAACYAAVCDVARHADSLRELSAVVRLCRQGLQFDTTPEEAKSLRRLAAWAYNRRGELQAEAGRDDMAMNDFQAAIQSDPNCALALHNRAITYAQDGQYEAALRDFDQALRINPGLALAHRNRAELLASLGRTDEAIRDYGQAIEQMPDDADLYRMRGHACHRIGQYDRALADLSRAIELAPAGGGSVADAYTQRGNVRAERGEYRQAMDDFGRALEAEPNWANAYRSKAWLLATCPDRRVRDPHQALAAARRTQQLMGPDDCYVLDALAAAYASDGQFDEAIRCQQRAIASAPEVLTDQLRSRLALYQHHQPFRNDPTSSDVQTASLETTTRSAARTKPVKQPTEARRQRSNSR